MIENTYMYMILSHLISLVAKINESPSKAELNSEDDVVMLPYRMFNHPLIIVKKAAHYHYADQLVRFCTLQCGIHIQAQHTSTEMDDLKQLKM